MEKSILFTGGARSGKSRLAEAATLRFAPQAIYISTAEAYDDEMRQRIEEHQRRRGPEWDTLHAPYDLAEALRLSDGGPPRLVDCLTLWLSNLILTDADLDAAVAGLCDAIQDQTSPVVLVTNEVGAGIVPENALARRFRDAAGRCNQTVAEVCDGLVLVVAGHPVQIKP